MKPLVYCNISHENVRDRGASVHVCVQCACKQQGIEEASAKGCIKIGSWKSSSAVYWC